MTFVRQTAVLRVRVIVAATVSRKDRELELFGFEFGFRSLCSGSRIVGLLCVFRLLAKPSPARHAMLNNFINQESKSARVVIIGGGITGLAAAHRLIECSREIRP